MDRRTLILGGTAALLSGCGRWSVDYEAGLNPAVSKNWTLRRVEVTVPNSLTVNHNNNRFAPRADIVWHGEPYGDRRVQVRQIIVDGLRQGGQGLSGTQGITLSARLDHFHAVTPLSVARAPGAVHNISYELQVFDAATTIPLTEPQMIQADLEAYVGDAAIVAEIRGQGQRRRIVDHIGRVTAGWLGIGFDQRRSFDSIGR
ncbi:MAG: DUF6778 family protein [Pseudomonadota bacterium]